MSPAIPSPPAGRIARRVTVRHDGEELLIMLSRPPSNLLLPLGGIQFMVVGALAGCMAFWRYEVQYTMPSLYLVLLLSVALFSIFLALTAYIAIASGPLARHVVRITGRQLCCESRNGHWRAVRRVDLSQNPPRHEEFLGAHLIRFRGLDDTVVLCPGVKLNRAECDWFMSLLAIDW